MTRIVGSSSCPSSHSVSTSAFGFAYSAMTPSRVGIPMLSVGIIPQVGLQMQPLPEGLEEPQSGLGLVGYHLGRPGRAQDHLGVDLLDAGDVGQEPHDLLLDQGTDRA